MSERVAIVGSRHRYSPHPVHCAVMGLPKGTIVVSGGAIGVDTIAADTARARGLEVIEHLPDYQQHGKAAPFIRNQLIAEDCDRLIALHDGESRGTLDVIERARKLGRPVSVLDSITGGKQ